MPFLYRVSICCHRSVDQCHVPTYHEKEGEVGGGGVGGGVDKTLQSFFAWNEN